MQFHSIKEWNFATVSINVEKEKASNLALLVGIGVAIAIVALLLLLLFMRKKKGGEKPASAKEMGGMEGMRPPEEPPKPR
jgi:hypothetical protein